MKITVDRARYDRYEQVVLDTLMKSLRLELERHPKLSEDEALELAERIGFGVCAILDASTVMSSDGDPVLPFLAFSVSDDERSNLIANEQGTSLHNRTVAYFDEW